METELNNRAKIFNKFIISVAPLIHKNNLTLFHEKYYIKEFKIDQIDENSARNIYACIVSRSKKTSVKKSDLIWLENQLRMFVWTLVHYSLFRNIQIQHFAEEEWEFFLILFPNKRRILFQYQAYNLLKNHNQYKKWCFQEDLLFERLVREDKYRLRWSDLGKMLFIESERKFFRTPKQCRERWLNHLDPSKMKKCWIEQQDFLLVEYVKFYGKKWANIAKKLQNRRNEHSIKNRFKSLMTKESKLFSDEISQKQIIDSLYHKMLSNKTENNSQKQGCLQVLQNKYETHKQQQDFIFEQERPDQSIFGYCDQFQIFQKHNPCSTQILRNKSLNIDQSQVNKKSFQKQEQNYVFQFSKMPNRNVIKTDQNSKKQAWQQHETQQRVRADLFLQEDPFQMLRNYLYNNSS